MIAPNEFAVREGTPMTTTEAYPLLMDTLNDLRRRWRVQKITEGVLLAVAGAAVVVVAVVAADNLLQLSPLGRFVLAIVLWGSLAAGLMSLIVRRFLEDRRDDFFAVLVEQKHPELRNRLINALQLGRGNENGSSPVLIAAIVNDAATATADLDTGASVDGRPARRAALLALGAVFLTAGYAFAFTPWFTNGLQRVLLPGANIAPYTATQFVLDSVEPQPPKNRFPEGEAITIRARVTGVIPATAQVVRISGADESRQQPAVMLPDKDANDTFLFTVPQAYESFKYYVVAGDARSPTYPVEVVQRPQVDNILLTYALPAYTGQKEGEPVAKPDGEISGIPGTKVHVEMKATKPLREASFVVQEGNLKRTVKLEAGADDRTWQKDFVIWERDRQAPPQAGRTHPLFAPTAYQIKLTDTDGYENADPLWRPVSLVTDQAPTVAITAPGRDVVGKADEAVALSVESRDDYGVGEVRLLYRINYDRGGDERVNDGPAQELQVVPHREAQPQKLTTDRLKLDVAKLCATHKELKKGGIIQYWATAADRNDVAAKPGQGESRHFFVYIMTPEQAAEKLDLKIDNYIEALEELVKLQTENRAHTYSNKPFDGLIKRQGDVRAKTQRLARAMERDSLPVTTIIKALDGLSAGPMVEVIKLLEAGQAASDPARASAERAKSLPIQDEIIKELKAMLARLQRNEQAKERLKKLEKKDPVAAKQAKEVLNKMIKDLDHLLKDSTELASKFERLPKKPTDETREDKYKDAMKELDELQKKWEKWAKGSVNELTKLPEGFVQDFDMKKDVNKVFEEVEKQAERQKSQEAPVALEDLGAGLATKMKEDLEVWLPDSPDNVKWVLEEPLDKKNMKIPEMPLPKALEDLIGDLLQKADEFDEDADDVTSAWGDNLDQAGWGTSDGPISSFSAKGKTGNDQPNNMELTGRSGDGRRGKSTGQMVGDTSRALQGRKTPARVGSEKYEQGQLKQEGQDDPNGSTGGGKMAGAGRKGLQGGTPPPVVKDMGRLSEKQAGMREKAEQVAKKLDTLGISSSRLNESIRLMKEIEKDLKERPYVDDARKRRVALTKLRSAFPEVQRTARHISQARDLPPDLRHELIQAADDAYPPGYESLLKSYYKALSTAEK